MGIKRHSEIWLTADVGASVERCKDALAALGCVSISATPAGEGQRVIGRVPRSFRHNRWAADVSIELTQMDGLVQAGVTIELAGNKHTEVLNELRKQLVDITAQAPAVPAAQQAAASTISVDALPKQVRKHTGGHISDHEPILFFLEGTQHQTLVALLDRVVIMKPGFMANATGGCRVTTIHYSEMTGVQVNTGHLMGVLQVTSPSYPAVRTDYWTSAGKAAKAGVDSATVAPNCIPIAKRQVQMWEPQLERLRRLVAEAHASAQPTPAPAPPVQGASAADRLKQLAELHDAGIVSAEEFESKKEQLLQEL
jgi:Short C-terminal domain